MGIFTNGPRLDSGRLVHMTTELTRRDLDELISLHQASADFFESDAESLASEIAILTERLAQVESDRVEVLRKKDQSEAVIKAFREMKGSDE